MEKAYKPEVVDLYACIIAPVYELFYYNSAYAADARAEATSAFALAYYGIHLYLLVSFYIAIEDSGFIWASKSQKPLLF